MDPVHHVAPPFRTHAGAGALASLARELDRNGRSRVALISGASIAANDEVMDRVTHALGGRLVATFAKAAEHSPLPLVEEAAAFLTENKIDAVIALGGGSAIVTTRAAVILSAEPSDIRALCTRRDDNGRLVSPRLTAPKMEQWVVPSTPTTACAKAGAAIREPLTGDRLALFDPKARAAGVIIDPVISTSAPPGVVTSSALNAFVMSIDGLQSLAGDRLAEAALRHAVVLLMAALPSVHHQFDEAIAMDLMCGAILAGQGSDHVGAGLAQPLSHALGPLAQVGNGVIEAMLLPHTMRFNVGVTDRALTEISRLLRPQQEPSAEAAVDAVQRLLSDLGVPSRLREVVDVHAETLDQALRHAAEDWAMKTVPRPADTDACRRLIEAAW